MNRWFFYFLKKAIMQRKGRFIIGSFSVMLTVGVVTALVVVSTGVRDKMGRQLSAYGANMILTPSEQKAIPEAVFEKIQRISGDVREATGHVYGTVLTEGRVVDIIGLDLKNPQGFRIKGRLPEKPYEAVSGIRLSDLMGLEVGSELTLKNPEGRIKITGVFEKGSDEDSALLLGLNDARKLLGIDGYSAILLSVNTSGIEKVSQLISSTFPGLRVKTIRQIAVAEERLLGKIELLMVLVTLVVLFSSAVALGSTMGANVIERMEEIGLMKAIGARREDVRGFFLFEAVFEGLVGSLAGLPAGVLIAEVVSLSAFHSYVPVKVLYLALPVVAGVALSLLATYLPVRDAVRAVPSEILRGE
ncbi:MAG: FtsX-like permease family protein [Nitrospirae bacterium]|nr:MAG: FtsX-like permease family protein [Nitrospirota bacterium]